MEIDKLLEAANKAAITHILPYEMTFSVEKNLAGLLLIVKDTRSSWELLEQVNIESLPDNIKEHYIICKVHAIAAKIISKRFPLVIP